MSSYTALTSQRASAEFCGYFKGASRGYFITLQSKYRCYDAIDSRWVVYGEQLLNAGAQFAGRLNEYCYGYSYRRLEDRARMKILTAVERGAKEGRLHLHLLAAYDLEPHKPKSIDEIKRFAGRKWCSEFDFFGSGTAVDVRELGDIESRIGYMLKQFDESRRFGSFSSVTLH